MQRISMVSYDDDLDLLSGWHCGRVSFVQMSFCVFVSLSSKVHVFEKSKIYSISYLFGRLLIRIDIFIIIFAIKIHNDYKCHKINI